jgi:diaminopimelate decarboxylase
VVGPSDGILGSRSEIEALAARIGTPLFTLDTTRILAALDTLRSGLTSFYPRSEVAYSTKTNYLSAILRRVLESGIYRLEVVSRHELELARRLGAKPSQLLFNGPVKTAADLRHCYELGITVNVDSVSELETAAAIGSEVHPMQVGLRVAARLANGSVSRFGIDLDDAAAVAGLHIHHSSRRDAQSYCDRIDRLAECSEVLGIRPGYLDIGGGIGSVPPIEIAAQLSYTVDHPRDLAAAIGRHALQKFGIDGPTLIIEPGIAILAEAMNYVTRIVSVKERGESGRIAVCDGSMFDVNPLRSTITPPCRLLSAVAPCETTPTKTRLYGGTCMEIDQIGSLPAGPAAQTGDLVVVTNVGAYSSCLAPEFIVPPAPVFDLASQALVRERPAHGCFTGAGA